MTRIILHGAAGHMGQVVDRIAGADSDCEIVAGIDPYRQVDLGYPVFATAKECEVEADVIIDFSSAAAVDGLLDFAAEKKLPVVLCTTGLSDQQLERVEKVSQETAILRSANMSLGINTLLELLGPAVKVFAEAGFDVEIVEAHHNQKLDAPSGTALALADSVNDASDGRYTYVYDRHERRQKRDAREIGISSIRGGNIVGEHEVIFAGEDEVITMKHQATSKNVFAKGAVEAAKFLKGKPAGLYDMRQVIAEHSGR